MKLYAIHMHPIKFVSTGSHGKPVADKTRSIPLLWGLDAETRSRLQKDASMVYAFPDRAEAEGVMKHVPDLFDMDEVRANSLHIVTYNQD